MNAQQDLTGGRDGAVGLSRAVARPPVRSGRGDPMKALRLLEQGGIQLESTAEGHA